MGLMISVFAKWNKRRKVARAGAGTTGRLDRQNCYYNYFKSVAVAQKFYGVSQRYQKSGLNFFLLKRLVTRESPGSFEHSLQVQQRSVCDNLVEQGGRLGIAIAPCSLSDALFSNINEDFPSN